MRINAIRRLYFVVAVSLPLACCWYTPPSQAQTREAKQLRQQVVALNRAEKYAEAIPLAQRELELDENTLRADHPFLVEAVNNLAALYNVERRISDLEPLLQRLVAIYEKAPDRRGLPQATANLAALYINELRYDDAAPLVKNLLGMPGRPDVLEALNDLSGLYLSHERFGDAIAIDERALAIYEQALGANNPRVAIALNSLAVEYGNQGRYADAEPLFKRAIAILEKAPNYRWALATVVNNFAEHVYDGQSRYEEGEQLHKRALALYEQAHDQTNIVEALNGLVFSYVAQGRYVEAEPLAKRSLEIREGTYGPDSPYLSTSLNYLGLLYQKQHRYEEAEPYLQRSLAICEKFYGLAGCSIALDQLIGLYNKEHRYKDAITLVQKMMPLKTAVSNIALQALFGAKTENLMPPEEAIGNSLIVVQRRMDSAVGAALNALAARFAAGTGRLVELVRQDQDLAAEASGLEKAMIATISKEGSRGDAAAEQKIREQMAAIAKRRDDLRKVLGRDFPDYVALSRPEPLELKEIQALLTDDEALVIVELGGKKVYVDEDTRSYVWAITRTRAEWKELAATADDISKQVSALRAQLDFANIKPFDPRPSFELYQKVLAPVEDLLAGKPRLSFVLNGALTSLPPQLLVTRDPGGKALKDVNWLIRNHAVTVLPSVESLKVLRGKSAIAEATKALIGFADPVFNPDAQQLAQNSAVVADVTAARGIRGTVADLAELKTELPALPETANELREVAASVHADRADIILGANATVTRVKAEKLDQFRIIYFATHGLLAGDVADFTKLNAEPALVLSLPQHPSELDDGLLTASEVAQLKLNADWVVLSACNTAAAERPGAEALSGLARAFFYAGARSLVVSNWEVETDSAVALMTGTFAALATDPKLSHAEALQKSMLAMIANAQHPQWADPKFWAPFIVVGEPAKPTN